MRVTTVMGMDPAKRLSITVVTDAAIPLLFDFLTYPANHVRIDGSRTLHALTGTTRITKIGDVFGMKVEFPDGPAYEVDNHVVAFTPDLEIAWMPARPGEAPIGVRWDWQFDVGPKRDTQITQTCDWSRVTDEKYLATRKLPRVSEHQMRRSIATLITLASSKS